MTANQPASVRPTPPGGADAFMLLGLPARYDLAPADIRAAHRRRVAALHPDRIADPLRQAESAHELARANEACALLLDDERRAEALLRRLGGPGKEEDRTLPEGFLVETMALREAMEEAIRSDDAAQRAHFDELVATRRRAHRMAVEALFARCAGAASIDPAPAAVRSGEETSTESRCAEDSSIKEKPAAEMPTAELPTAEMRTAELPTAELPTAAGSAERPDPGPLALVRRELNAWRYVERMAEALRGDSS